MSGCTHSWIARVAGVVFAVAWVGSGAAAPPSWVAPPESVAGAVGTDTAVALADDGTAYFAWVSPAPNFDVLVSTRPPGGDWLSPQNLTDTLPGRTSSPTVVVNGTGHAGVVWLRDPTGGGVSRMVEATVRVPGAAAFPAPATGGSPAIDLAGTPVAAMDGAGSVYVAWRATPGPTYKMRKLFAGGTPAWEGAGPFVSGEASNFDPVIAASPAGHVAVAFITFSPSFLQNDVDWVLRSPGALTWTNGSSLTFNPATDAAVDVAVGDDGSTFFSWQTGLGPFGVQTALAAPGSTTATLDPLPLDSTITAPTPRITAGPAGTALVAYEDDNDTGVSGNLCDPFRMRTRAANGVIGAPVTLVNGNVVLFAANSSGDVVTLFQPTTNTGTIIAPNCVAGGLFKMAARTAVGAESVFEPPLIGARDVAINARGAGLFGYAFLGALQAVGFDNSPPVLTGLTVPATAAPGQSIAMSVTASDSWKTGSTTWSFGDGTTASGSAVSHAFSAPGTFTVTASHTDLAGFVSSVTARVIVVAPPPPVLASTVTLRVRLRPLPVAVTTLTVAKAKGTRVSVRCRRGCSVRTAQSIATPTRSLTRLFRSKTLRLPAVIEVRITKAGSVGRYTRFTVTKRSVTRRRCQITLTGSLTACVNR